MNTTFSPSPRPGAKASPTPPHRGQRTRALVLGGGGAAGNAWQLGLIAGLADAGIDITTADLIVGTSSGATVAAQITSGACPADLYASVLRENPQPRPAPMPATARDYLEWSDAVIASAADMPEVRRALGAAALQADASNGAASVRWHDIVESRLPVSEWPDRHLLITAIDATTGQPVVFSHETGIALIDAVAASTSSRAPYRVGQTSYLDGGYRRNENADLAAGFDDVLVLSPFSGRTRYPLAWGMQLEAQVAELRTAGSAVQTVFPDASAGDVFGANALDPSTRPQAARGGFDQANALAKALAPAWG